jgi:hypothetical protein
MPVYRLVPWFLKISGFESCPAKRCGSFCTWSRYLSQDADRAGLRVDLAELALGAMLRRP